MAEVRALWIVLPKGWSLAAVAAAAALLKLLWKRWRAFPRGMPTHKGHWLLGVLPGFAQAAQNKEQNDFLHRIHQRLGQTYNITAPLGHNCVVTTNPKNVEHILLHNFKNYPKGPIMRIIFHDLLGEGIFNSDGQEWLHQRKITSQMFTAKLFKEHIWGVVRQNAKKTRNILQAVEHGKSLDVFNLMNRFTLDTIGEIGFGKCIGSLEDPSSPFLKSFDAAQQVTFERWFSLKYFAQAQLGFGHQRKKNEHFARLDQYSRNVVQELQTSMARDSTKANGVAFADLEAGKSFLGLFLEDARKKGQTLSEDFLRDLVLNFLIAGRDTTAQALSWTFYCLATHPEVEAKARQEVCERCGAEEPSYEDIKHMPFLNAILSEALRLYPSVPIDVKLTEADDVWPDGSRVAAQTLVGYNMYAMGRDPAIWGEDAGSFRPERWMEMKEVPSNYHYAVFNAGPRECLGKRLAMIEMKTCLAMILPSVSLKLAVPAEDIKQEAQLTIGMSSGLPCFVECAAKREAAHSDATVASTAACSDWTASTSD